MNKNYKLGDTVSLVTVKFTSSEDDKEKLVYYVPNEEGINKAPYEKIFPYDEHPYVRAEIYVYEILIIDIFQQQNDDQLFIAANKLLNTIKHRFDGENSYDPVVDNQSVANQFTLYKPFDLPADDARCYIWLKDDNTFAVDVDYIKFIISENQKWTDNKTYQLDQEFFNLLTGFINKKKGQLNVDNSLVPNNLGKLREVAFDQEKNKVYHANGRNTCALIAQFVLPKSVNHNMFLNHVKEELLSAFPFKRDLKESDLSIHYEKISVNTRSSDDFLWYETQLEVKIIIFTSLYNRLQSAIVGKRNTGTLADKLMTAWADSMFDLGVDEDEIKLNLYLNDKRLFIVNHISATIFDIYSKVVLPINDMNNWRNKVEAFVKQSTITHGNKPVNLCCLKLNLPFDTLTIPENAMLRLKAEIKCEKNSELLWVNDKETTYLFYTERCVKARLKTGDEIKMVSHSMTNYLKKVFQDKIHANYTIKDYFTIFNLYSDIDIAQVHQTIIARNNILAYTKPTLIAY